MNVVRLVSRVAMRRLLTSASLVALASTSAVAADIPEVVPPVVVVPVELPGPVFDIHVNALYMTRRSDPAPLVSFYPLPGTGDVIDASDLDFNWRPGIEARVGLILPGGFGFEARGMWVAEMSAEFVTEPDDDVIVNTNPGTELASVILAAAFGETRLWSVDANATFALGGGFQLFGGVAVVRLQDELILLLANDPGLGGATWLVTNRMIGPQIGARMKTGDGQHGVFFAAEGRVGFLLDRVESVMAGDFTVFGGGEIDGAAIATARSLMLAGNANIGFHFSETFAVHVGYQAMWLGNVALATGQVGTTGPLDVPGTVAMDVATGRFLAHGVRLGIDLTF